MSFILLLLGLASVDAAPALARELPSGNAEAGETVAVACQACHGPASTAVNPLWPLLSGQREAYLLKQLQDFRFDRRADPAMSPMAEPLTDEQVADVAAYWAAQEPAPPTTPPAADDPALASGRQLYEAGRPVDGLPPCAGCHGRRGDGVVGVFDGGVPAVGGQQIAYLRKQLLDFRSGERTNDHNRVMQAVASLLTDDDVDALAAYTATLR